MNKESVINLVHQTKSILYDPEKTGSISVKGRADYVTAADRGVQDFLERELAKRYPQIGMFAEEKVNETPDPDRPYWILDPIDGTTNLIHHYQLSAVSLALCEHGEVTFGVVYNPFTEETFTAEKGGGAYLNGGRFRLSGCEALEDALVSFGSSPYRKELAKLNFPMYQRIFEKCSDFRRGGSAALELCYVGLGRLDAYLERDLKPWDYSAGWLVASEAGAVCSTFDGGGFPAFRNADILSCAPGIYEALREQIA